LFNVTILGCTQEQDLDISHNGLLMKQRSLSICGLRA